MVLSSQSVTCEDKSSWPCLSSQHHKSLQSQPPLIRNPTTTMTVSFVCQLNFFSKDVDASCTCRYISTKLHSLNYSHRINVRGLGNGEANMRAKPWEMTWGSMQDVNPETLRADQASEPLAAASAPRCRCHLSSLSGTQVQLPGHLPQLPPIS